MKRIFFLLSVWALLANVANAASACHQPTLEPASSDGLAALAQICVTDYGQTSTGNGADDSQPASSNCQHHFPSVAAYVPAAPQAVAIPQVLYPAPAPLRSQPQQAPQARCAQLPARAPPVAA